MCVCLLIHAGLKVTLVGIRGPSFIPADIITLPHSMQLPPCLKSVIICIASTAWWRHEMETFSVILAICAGNSPVPGEFTAQRPVTRSFDVFFDIRLNKRLSKQSWGWWFETPSRPVWRHRNGTVYYPLSCNKPSQPLTSCGLMTSYDVIKLVW